MFVTDGEDRLRNSFLEAFNKKKKEDDFNVLFLVIGCSINMVEHFSDEIV